MRLYVVGVDGPPIPKRAAWRIVRETLAQLPERMLDRLRRRMWAGAPVELSGRTQSADGRYGGPMVECLPWAMRREVLSGPFPATWDFVWMSMLAGPRSATVGPLGVPIVSLNPVHTLPVRWPGEGKPSRSYVSYGSAIQSLTYEDVRTIAQSLCGNGAWPRTGSMKQSSPKLTRGTNAN